MKINQIIGEHKKGVRAKIYNKKGPEPRKVAKQPAQAGIATAFAEDNAPQVYKVTKSDPNTGLTLSKPDGTQLILPPDKMNAIAANPNDPNKYLLNPDAITQQATSGQPSGPEIGREVEVNTAEGDVNPEQSAFEDQDDQDEQGDVGGDATDAYIDGVIDQDYERAQGRLRELAGMPPAAGEAPATQQPSAPSMDNVAVTLDTADGFKDAIKKGMGQAGAENPETVQKIDQLIAPEADGSVDIKKTFMNLANEFGDTLPQISQFMRDLLATMKQGVKSPEFAQFDPEVKQSVLDTIADLERMVPSMDQQIANYKTKLQQAQQDLAPSPSPRPAAGVQETKELDAMLRIAGLR